MCRSKDSTNWPSPRTILPDRLAWGGSGEIWARLVINLNCNTVNRKLMIDHFGPNLRVAVPSPPRWNDLTSVSREGGRGTGTATRRLIRFPWCVDSQAMSEGQKSSRLFTWSEAGNCTDFWFGSYTFIDFNVPEAGRLTTFGSGRNSEKFWRLSAQTVLEVARLVFFLCKGLIYNQERHKLTWWDGLARKASLRDNPFLPSQCLAVSRPFYKQRKAIKSVWKNIHSSGLA